MRLANKIAIVTGASSGIGRASALLFASEGARIVACDIADAGGEETVAAIKAKGGEAVFIHADVSRLQDVEHLVKSAIDRFSRIDILFNVAGIFMKRTPVEDITDSLWDRLYNVNVKSVFLTSKIAVPYMKLNGGGVIVNTASMTAFGPARQLSAYASSKGAVITFTKILAFELAPFNIRVNCIAPKLTDTPMIQNELEEMQKSPQASVTGPLSRIARPEEMANAALFLASNEASMVSGICLEVNAGQTG